MDKYIYIYMFIYLFYTYLSFSPQGKAFPPQCPAAAAFIKWACAKR